MDSPSVHRKAELRAAALARRSLVSDAAQAVAAEAIAARAAPVLVRMRPDIVAGTMPFRGEVNPWPLLDRALELGATVVLPATTPEGLVFRRWARGQAMTVAPFGMLEPLPDAEALTPDFIILPLAAFDRARNRIGYGRAHYDRAIARLRAGGADPRLMGLALAVQEVAEVPAEAHDVRLDWVATEAELIGDPQ